MKDKTNSYNIVLYALLVFALSGLLVLLQSVFAAAGGYWVVFPQFAPALTVFFLFLVRRRKGGLFDKKRRLGINKKVLAYSVCAALFVFIVFGSFGCVLAAFEKPVLQWETPSLAIGFICMLVGCITEEIGWRGFLLPALNRRFSLIVSSLLVGVLWGAWHLDFGDGVVGFLVTILFMAALSVIISWMQIKNGGSIIPAIVLHFFVNFFARSTLFDMSLTAHFMLALVLGICGAILFFADRKTFMSKENAA